MNILHLPGWTVLKQSDTMHSFNIESTYDKAEDTCVKCGIVGRLYKHGTWKQEINDLPIHGKPSIISLARLRYHCRECGKTFLQPLPDLAPVGTMTKRLVAYIERQATKRTFMDVAAEVGVSGNTISNVFNAYVDKLDATVFFETPQVLGIDETHLLRHPRCVLTNVEKRTILDVLEDRNKSTVNQRLFWMPNKERIRVVTMDMWKPYRDAVKAVLPGTAVVIDKFHVVRMATQALESVRKGMAASLNTNQRRILMRSRFLLLRRTQTLNVESLNTVNEWITKMPELGTAYNLKEGFYGLYDLSDKKIAIDAYKEWKMSIPDSMVSVFKPLTTAVDNWGHEIFAYFDHRYTNAVTEALNGVAKVINRNGRGYSFKVIRAKMLYSKTVQDEWLPKGAGARYGPAADFDLYEIGEPVVRTNGTDIGRLHALLERLEEDEKRPKHSTPKAKRKHRQK